MLNRKLAARNVARQSGFKKSSISGICSICFVVISLSFGAPRANAEDLTDGRDILLKCFNTYLRMQSYNGRSNTDSVLQDASGRPLKQIGTSVEMKFKRPNKLRLDFVTPIGSRVVWSNATDFGVYDPSSRKYWIVPTAPTMDTLIPVLVKQANTSAFFDPLYGLSRNIIPAEMTGIKLKNKLTYNGHPVYLVTASLRGKGASDWSWWIDRNTLLIYKVQQITRNLQQKYTMVENGKTVEKTRSVVLVMRNIITDSKPNAQINDADFQYQPPAGATPRITPPDTGGKR